MTKRKTFRAKIRKKFEISAADLKTNSVIITKLHAKNIVVNEKQDSKSLTDLLGATRFAKAVTNITIL